MKHTIIQKTVDAQEISLTLQNVSAEKTYNFQIYYG